MATRQPSHLIISIFIDIAVIKFLTSEESKFTLSAQCLDSSCVQQNVGRFRSRLECASNCSGSESCIGFSYATDGMCSILQDGCSFDVKCAADQSPLLIYKQITCKNKGQWNVKLETCDCVDGWVGLRCERYPYSCKELNAFRYNSDIHRVVIDVYRNRSRLVYTQCLISSYYSLTYLFANGGTESFNRIWPDYLHGFHVGEWHWWLGLENIRAFNQMGLRDVVYMVVAQKVNFVWQFAHENFTVSDESAGFSFTSDFKYNNSNGTYTMATQVFPEDLIARSQNVPFSTPDRDQDNDAQNCAALHAAGWWFNTCSSGEQINPLGKIWVTSPALGKILLPGIDTENQEFKQNYQSALIAFVE